MDKKIVRCLPWRIVNETLDFSKDYNETLKFIEEKSLTIKKLLLCFSEQEKIVVKDKFDSELRIFNKDVEFKILTGKKLSDFKDLIYFTQKCLLNNDASSFSANNHCIFFNNNNITFGEKNDTTYKENYENFVKFNNGEIKSIPFKKARVNGKKDINGNSIPGNSIVNLDNLEKLNGIHFMHFLKHLVSQSNGLFPYFKSKHENFEKNALFNVCSEIKDFSRKNKENLDRYNENEKKKKELFEKFELYKNEFYELQNLLKINNWNLKEHFVKKWDYFLDCLENNKEIKSNYPDFIFEFLNKNKHLWNEEDFFEVMLDYILLDNKNYKDHAIQPLYSSNDLVFGNCILEWNLMKIEGQYAYFQIRLLNKFHEIKCHIPRKYRNVKLELLQEIKYQTDSEGNKFCRYKNGKLHCVNGPAVEFVDGGKEWWIKGKQFTEQQFNNSGSKNNNGYKIQYVDEKDFKRNRNIIKTREMNSGFLRTRKAKKRRDSCLYLYVPLNTQQEIKKIENNVGDNIGFFDLGRNELVTLRSITITDTPNYVRNKNTIDNSQVVESKTQFVKDMNNVYDLIYDIRDWKRAFDLFAKNRKSKFKATEDKLEKIKKDESGCTKKLTGMYYRLAGKYKKLLAKRSKFDSRFTLWEDSVWIKLGMDVISLLKRLAFKGKVLKLREKIDYKNLIFRDLIERHEDTVKNRKEDLYKKLSSWTTDRLNDLDIKYIATESLGHFTQDRKNSHKTNKMLQIWGHRTLLGKLKQSCMAVGIEIKDSISPSYNSQLDDNGKWVFRPKGSKMAITQDLKEVDADEFACNSMDRRWMGKTNEKELYPDIYLLKEDRGICKNTECIYVKHHDGTWSKTNNKKSLNEEIKKLKSIRLFRWTKSNLRHEFLERKEHKSRLKALGEEFERIKDVQKSAIKIGQFEGILDSVALTA